MVNLLGKPWKGNDGILTYHRVLPDEKINEDLDVGLAILASNFEKQIKLLKTNYDIVSIIERNKRKKIYFSTLDVEQHKYTQFISINYVYSTNTLECLCVL